MTVAVNHLQSYRSIVTQVLAPLFSQCISQITLYLAVSLFKATKVPLALQLAPKKKLIASFTLYNKLFD